MLSNGSYTRTYGAPERDLQPQFYMDSVKNEAASINAGREIYQDIERVKVIIPGAIPTVSVNNVTDHHRRRWPQQYEAFRKGQEAPVSGTPIEEWPLLTRSHVGELKHWQIRTVEDLANLSDYQMQAIKIGGAPIGRILRERARAFLDAAEREALTNKLTHENDVLRSRVGILENQVGELSAHITALIGQNRQMLDRPDPIAGYAQANHDAVGRAAERWGTTPAVAAENEELSSSLAALAKLPAVRGVANGEVAELDA